MQVSLHVIRLKVPRKETACTPYNDNSNELGSMLYMLHPNSIDKLFNEIGIAMPTFPFCDVVADHSVWATTPCNSVVKNGLPSAPLAVCFYAVFGLGRYRSPRELLPRTFSIVVKARWVQLEIKQARLPTMVFLILLCDGTIRFRRLTSGAFNREGIFLMRF